MRVRNIAIGKPVASECEMMMIRVSLPADSFMPLAAGAAALLLDSGRLRVCSWCGAKLMFLSSTRTCVRPSEAETALSVLLGANMTPLFLLAMMIAAVPLAHVQAVAAEEGNATNCEPTCHGFSCDDLNQVRACTRVSPSYHC